MKKKFTVLLLFFFVAIVYLPTPLVKASGVVSELKISSELTRWVLDEPSNTLYAISQTDKTLFFINATTMKIEKKLILQGDPTDIIKDNGKLYICLNSTSNIAVVDMKTKTIVKILKTTSNPCRLVKDGGKIYYTEYDNYSRLFEYDTNTNTDKALLINKELSKPSIAINPNKHLLYLGESGGTNVNLFCYSITDKKIVGKTKYDHDHGFVGGGENTFCDEGNVFYSNMDFSQDNLTQIHGDFGNMGDIVSVKNDFVFTSTSIYNKNTHVKLGDYDFNIDLLEASGNTVYIYNKLYGSIKRFNNSNKAINSSNIIALISGKAAPEVQHNTKGVQVNSETYKLQMNSKLTQWILDEATNTLFAISKDDKTLFFINAKSLNIEKTITFTSSPTDILKDNGKLYICLDKIYQIAVVDMTSRTVAKTLYTSSDPYKVVKDGSNLYYTEGDQWCSVYSYDLVTNTDKVLSTGMLYEPDIAVNTDKHLLYFGESESYNIDITYYSIEKDKVIGRTSYSDRFPFPYRERYTLHNGGNVFFAGWQLNDNDPTKAIHKYDDENIILAKYGCVFTYNSIYSMKTYSKLLDFGSEMYLAEISSKADLYLYNLDSNTILGILPDRTPPVVTGVVNGGSYNHEITIGFNEGTATLDGKAFKNGNKVSSQGSHVLKVVDSSGNSTTVKFTIDTAAPTGKFKINNGTGTTNTRAVTLSISATDAAPTSGIGYMIISESTNFNGAKWIPYSTTNKLTLSTGNGKKNIYIKFKDNAGNISSVYSQTIVLNAKS